jgi:diacylglycerol kinase family enzyme
VRITLVHNPTAGSQEHSAADLVGLVRAAGHDVRYCSTKDEGLERMLADPGDLVLVAGGDGTVADVCRRLVGRRISLAILPLGTSNNVANALGVDRDPKAVVAGLQHGRQTPLDIAMARGPWGSGRWIESAGLGVFGAMLRDAAKDDAPTDRRTSGVRRLQRELARLRPRHCAVAADGKDCSGSFLVLAAMNIACIGPRVCLANAADPGDGWLDLVMVHAGDREALDRWLAHQLDKGKEAVPPVEVRRVRRLRMEWDPGTGHLDDHAWPDGAAENSRSWVELEITDPPQTVVIGPATA